MNLKTATYLPKLFIPGTTPNLPTPAKAVANQSTVVKCVTLDTVDNFLCVINVDIFETS